MDDNKKRLVMTGIGSFLTGLVSGLVIAFLFNKPEINHYHYVNHNYHSHSEISPSAKSGIAESSYINQDGVRYNRYGFRLS